MRNADRLTSSSPALAGRGFFFCLEPSPHAGCISSASGGNACPNQEVAIREALACCKVAVDACFLFLSDLLCWFGRSLLDRPLADRRFPGDAPTVGDWESCGLRGRGGQEATARTSYRQRSFVEHDLGESTGSTVDVAPS